MREARNPELARCPHTTALTHVTAWQVGSGTQIACADASGAFPEYDAAQPLLYMPEYWADHDGPNE